MASVVARSWARVGGTGVSGNLAATSGLPGSTPSGAPSVVAANGAGSLPGAPSVTATGAFTYTVPIQVPEGRAGMTPTVTLQYQSRGGAATNVGKGWALDAGASSIARCGKFFASGFRVTPEAERVQQTNFPEFTLDDQLCLDGEKLEVVSGTYGRQGSEYRTESDVFAKIVAEGGCASCRIEQFRVFYKDGTIGTFEKDGGRDGLGRKLEGYVRDQSRERVSLAWAQTKWEDRQGNAVRYFWTRSSQLPEAQAPLRLELIRYTTCEAAACPYGTEHSREVGFLYERSHDPRTVFSNGVRLDWHHRLRAIHVKGASGERLWRYDLGYSVSATTDADLLRDLRLCAEQSRTCFGTHFRYSGPAVRAYRVSGDRNKRWNLVNSGQEGVAGGDVNGPESAFVLVDVNADGNKDVIVKEWPSSARDARTNRLSASNNDARNGPTDFLLLGRGRGEFSEPIAIDLRELGRDISCEGSAPRGEIADLTEVQVVDLDGDGREELVADINRGCPFFDIGDPLLRRSRNFGIAFDLVPKVLRWDPVEQRLVPSGLRLPPRSVFSDLNGDGLPEFLPTVPSTFGLVLNQALRIASPRRSISQATGLKVDYLEPPGHDAPGPYFTGLLPPSRAGLNGVREPFPFNSIDLNGDGRHEVVQSTWDGASREFGIDPTGRVAVRRYRTESSTVSSKDEFGVDPKEFPWPGNPDIQSARTERTRDLYGDVNGDGLPDLVYARLNARTGAYEWFYRWNTGVSFLPEVPVGFVDLLERYGRDLSLRQEADGLAYPKDAGLRLADMNGDGREDILLLGNENGSVLLSRGASFAPPEALPSRGLRIFNPNAGHPYPYSVVADLDGDGVNELVEMVLAPEDLSKRVLLSVGLVSADHLTRVSHARGTNRREVLRVSYRKLSEPQVHESDGISRQDGDGQQRSEPCLYPAPCVSSGFVVSRLQQDNLGRDGDTSYFYSGARADATGRGFLGFREIVTTDNVTGSGTVQTFDQKPFEGDGFHIYDLYTKTTQTNLSVAGDPALASIEDVGGRFPVSKTTTDYLFDDQLPRRLRLVVETTTGYDSASLELDELIARREHKVRRVFDEYGNVQLEATTVRDLEAVDEGLPPVATVALKRYGYTYRNNSSDLENWHVGLVEESRLRTDTHDAACEALECEQVQRLQTFVYEDSPGRQLQATSVEPLDSQLRLDTTYSYDEAGLVRAVSVGPPGEPARTTEVDYDANGVFAAEVRNAEGHATSLNYHPDLGHLQYAEGHNGEWVETTVDELGREREVRRSDGSITTIDFGSIWEGGTPDWVLVSSNTGGKLLTVFDERERAVLVLAPAFDGGRATTVGTRYGPLGNPVERSFREVEVAGSFEEEVSLLIASEEAAQERIDAHFLEQNNEAPEVFESAHFDVLGRPASAIRGDIAREGAKLEIGAGEVSLFEYPRVGVTVIQDPDGRRRTSIEDARGQVRRIYEAEPGMATTYHYGAHGALVSAQAAAAPAETFRRDAFGRLLEWSVEGGDNKRVFEYDAFGQVSRISDLGELDIRFAYDRLGRPIRRVDVSPEEVAERDVSYLWDTAPREGGGRALGRIAAVTVAGGHQTRYRYDHQARLRGVDEIGRETLSMSYFYDGVGRLSRLEYPRVDVGGQSTGLTIEQIYSEHDGSLTALKDVTGVNDRTLWSVESRHPLGMLTGVEFIPGEVSSNAELWNYVPNSLRLRSIDVGEHQQTFAYTAGGRLKERDSRGFNQGAREVYGYDNSPWLRSYLREGPTEADQYLASFEVDDRGFLGEVRTDHARHAQSVESGWTLPVGTTRFVPGSGAGPGNRALGYSRLLTTVQKPSGGAIDYAYDRAGRQVHAKASSGPFERKLSGFNTFNLPTRIVHTNAQGTTLDVALAYDGLGKRVSKERADGPRIDYFGKYAELTEDSNVAGPAPPRDITYRVFAEGMPVLEARGSAPGEYKQLFTDQQGSVTACNTGPGATSYSGFFPNGARWDKATACSSMGYGGHVHDDDLGLINMGGRLYDPEQRRFLSRDPVLVPFEPGGLEGYSYVRNDPMNLIDPTGFQPQSVCEQPNSSGEEVFGWAIKGTVSAVGWVVSNIRRGLRRLFGGGGRERREQRVTITRCDGPLCYDTEGNPHRRFDLTPDTQRRIGEQEARDAAAREAAAKAAAREAARVPAPAAVPEVAPPEAKAPAPAPEAPPTPTTGPAEEPAVDPATKGLVRVPVFEWAIPAARGVRVAWNGARAGWTVARGAWTAARAGASVARSAFQGARLSMQLAAEQAAGAVLPKAITGFSRHGLNQAISRDGVGVATRAIANAFKNPLRIAGQSGGRFIFTGQNATVVVNAQGRVITTWANSSAGVRAVVP